MFTYRRKFVDREEAGRELASKLLEQPFIAEAAPDELLVLSIPRGGVVVGAAIVERLGCAHEVVIVKKIGFPGQPELAIGAVAENGFVVLNKEMLHYCHEIGQDMGDAIEQARTKVETYIAKFRSGQALEIEDKIVILTDDGVATGETMKAAVCWINARFRADQAKCLVVAVPVCSPRTAGKLEGFVDNLVCLEQPSWFFAVGQFYWNFKQVSDEQVTHYLSAKEAAL